MLGHIQDSVENCEVHDLHIPALNRQTIPDLFLLLGGDPHSVQSLNISIDTPSVCDLPDNRLSDATSIIVPLPGYR